MALVRLKHSFQHFSINRLKRNFFFREDEKNWAVVTGCTSGVGRSFAETLIKSGINVILIARNQSKLDNFELLKNEDGSSPSIKKLVMDFKNTDLYEELSYKRIKDELKDYKISLLVNNVGVAGFGGKFTNNSFSKNKEMIHVNIMSHMFITQIVLENRSNQSNTSKLGIINISSAYGEKPTPGVSIYSSSKAFLTSFSSCLKFELDKQVSTLCVCPFYIKTNMVKLKKSFFVLDPEDVVYSCYWKLGLMTKTFGNWRHSILGYLAKITPNLIYSSYFNNYYKKIYERYSDLRGKRSGK